MPTILIDAPPRPEPPEPPHKKWTRCELATVEGLERFELIDGDVINKMGKKRPHVIVATFMYGWLAKVFGGEYIESEPSIDVAPEDNPTNEPLPDLIVLARPSRQIRVNPRPEDIRLIVEIADTTVRFDLTMKAELYARAGIVEYWVFDVQKTRLIVHREPRDGRYAEVLVYAIGESVAPLAAPEHKFEVSEVFPL